MIDDEYLAPQPTTYSLRIGDDRFVFPVGTTREEAQSVMDEAWALHLKHLAEQNP